MGIFKFIAKKYSMGPAVKVWTDAYNIFYEKNIIGLGNRKSAEEYFDYIKTMNIMDRRDGDFTKSISFQNIETYLLKTEYVNYNPLLDLPTFLAVMMFFEIKLMREAFRDHPNTVDSFLEIIYEVSLKNSPNGVISKSSEFIQFSKDLLNILSSTFRF